MRIFMDEIINALKKIKLYCEKENFKGYDVADSIETPLLKKTILGKSKYVRFFIQQLTGHRIGFVNIRPILCLPKNYNAKGIALFLNGYCNIFEILQVNPLYLDNYSRDECLSQINSLAELLISLREKSDKGYGWGYPYGWQSRNFYFPPNTPTVVASSFAVEALLNAYEITKNKEYKDMALGTSTFVLEDLHRAKVKDGFLFSYSAYSGNDTVFNASLLGARILLRCYEYTRNEEYKTIAQKAIDTCVEMQRDDGSWLYGLGKTQGWIDNFHTGYNLEVIQAYKDITGENRYDECLKKGLDFFIKNHFDNEGVPKYYHNKQYPIDIHCCGEIFVVLSKLGIYDENKELANRVFKWTIDNMYDNDEGYFYFQKHKLLTNKVPLMRWSEAFMFNALSYYFIEKIKNQ